MIAKIQIEDAEQSGEFEIDTRDYILSLEKGMAVLKAFGPGRATLTLSEVAELTGLSRAAARRFLLTFATLGYVGTDRKVFWLKSKTLELSRGYLESQPGWEVAQSVIEDTARKTSESCSLCTLDGADIVYVCRSAVSRFVSVNISVGSRLSAFPTALGRMLLAQLPDADIQRLLNDATLQRHTPDTVTDKAKLLEIIQRARHDGFIIVNQELEVGLLSVAVPVQGFGRDLAAIGISVPIGRISRKELTQRLLPILKDSANQISANIGTSFSYRTS